VSGGTASSGYEASLGIRALLSEHKSVWSQVAMGGTTAVVVYLILQLFAQDFGAVSYGVIGFAAGYSEPFFNRTLQVAAGLAERPSGLY
jgi:hypothetical protein